MKDLIERLEKVTGPNFWLDNQIRIAVSADAKADGRPCTLMYTSSIDAALTLVPEGLGWLVREHDGKPGPDGTGRGKAAFSNVYDRDDDCGLMCGAYAISPAVALCVAALKARQAITAGQRGEP